MGFPQETDRMKEGAIVRIGKIALNIARQELVYQTATNDGSEVTMKMVALSQSQFKLLYALAANLNQPVMHEKLSHVTRSEQSLASLCNRTNKILAFTNSGLKITAAYGQGRMLMVIPELPRKN